MQVNTHADIVSNIHSCTYVGKFAYSTNHIYAHAHSTCSCARIGTHTFVSKHESKCTPGQRYVLIQPMNGPLLHQLHIQPMDVKNPKPFIVWTDFLGLSIAKTCQDVKTAVRGSLGGYAGSGGSPLVQQGLAWLWCGGRS